MEGSKRIDSSLACRVFHGGEHFMYNSQASDKSQCQNSVQGTETSR